MKTKPITTRGLRSVATRAVNSFTPSNGNGANAFLVDGYVRVSTRAGGGDNVPWAKSLLDRVVARICARYPNLIPDYHTEEHSCGSCSIILRITNP